MGSGTSRGKRVAPASVSEASVSKTAAPKQDSRPLEPLGIHGVPPRNARSGGRAQPDRHSEGTRDSDLSREDVDGELDTVLADEERGGAAGAKKKAVVRSKTYGLCHFSQEDEEDSSPEEKTRGSSCGGSRGVNRRSNGAFKQTSASSSRHGSSSSRGFLTRGSVMEALPTTEKQQPFGKCHNSSVTMPVILYDGSEEELMDTIEREFS